MNIKPKAQIGDTVKIVGCDVVQIGNTYLWARRNGRTEKYTVQDIEVTISLKTGTMKYKYLIGRGSSSYTRGWVTEKTIELTESEVKTA